MSKLLQVGVTRGFSILVVPGISGFPPKYSLAHDTLVGTYPDLIHAPSWSEMELTTLHSWRTSPSIDLFCGSSSNGPEDILAGLSWCPVSTHLFWPFLLLFTTVSISSFLFLVVCGCAKSLQVCLTLCNSMGCSLPGSSVHGILQASILECVAVPSSSRPRAWTHVSQVSCIGSWVL